MRFLGGKYEPTNHDNVLKFIKVWQLQVKRVVKWINQKKKIKIKPYLMDAERTNSSSGVQQEN